MCEIRHHFCLVSYFGGSLGNIPFGIGIKKNVFREYLTSQNKYNEAKESFVFYHPHPQLSSNYLFLLKTSSVQCRAGDNYQMQKQKKSQHIL